MFVNLTSSIGVPWELVRNESLSPDLLNQRSPGCGPAMRVLTSPPGGFDIL